MLDEVLTRQRNAAAMSALSRRDTIVVASVSCIFDIGPPQVCRDLALPRDRGRVLPTWRALSPGSSKSRISPHDIELEPKTFRVSGPHVEVFPLYEDHAYRIEVQNGHVKTHPGDRPAKRRHDSTVRQYHDLPARLHLLRDGWIDAALQEIQEELDGRLQEFQRQGKRWRPNGWKRRLERH